MLPALRLDSTRSNLTLAANRRLQVVEPQTRTRSTPKKVTGRLIAESRKKQSQSGWTRYRKFRMDMERKSRAGSGPGG